MLQMKDKRLKEERNLFPSETQPKIVLAKEEDGNAYKISILFFFP